MNIKEVTDAIERLRKIEYWTGLYEKNRETIVRRKAEGISGIAMCQASVGDTIDFYSEFPISINGFLSDLDRTLMKMRREYEEVRIKLREAGIEC